MSSVSHNRVRSIITPFIEYAVQWGRRVYSVTKAAVRSFARCGFCGRRLVFCHKHELLRRVDQYSRPTSVESLKDALLIALVEATQPLCLTKCRVAHGGACCLVNG